jgi:hypothetical protein
MIYTNFQDPWVAQLNAMIKPSEMVTERVQVAYSPTELRDRIIQAQNATDIRKSRVGAFGPAPWMRR